MWRFGAISADCLSKRQCPVHVGRRHAIVELISNLAGHGRSHHAVVLVRREAILWTDFVFEQPFEIFAAEEYLPLDELDVDVLLNDAVHMVQMLGRQEATALL